MIHGNNLIIAALAMTFAMLGFSHVIGDDSALPP
jgi:hypothetical protein